MIALPSLYRTTGGHLNHDRWMSKTTSRLLVCLWCVHVGGCQILLYFLLSHRRWVPLFFQFTRNACRSVLSSNDCLTFPLYIWPLGNTWNMTGSECDYLTTPWMTVVCTCGWLSQFASFSFSQLRGWVPLFFSFLPMMHAMSLHTSNDCLAFSLSDHWGTLGTWQEVSKIISRLLEWLWCVHVGGCYILLYFLSSNTEGESHCSFHFTQ